MPSMRHKPTGGIARHEDHQCGAGRIHRARTGQRADPEGLEDRVRRRLEFREPSELVRADGADRWRGPVALHVATVDTPRPRAPSGDGWALLPPSGSATGRRRRDRSRSRRHRTSAAPSRAGPSDSKSWCSRSCTPEDTHQRSRSLGRSDRRRGRRACRGRTSWPRGPRRSRGSRR